MSANDFYVDIEDLHLLDDAEIIARADAQAWNPETDDYISISKIDYDLKEYIVKDLLNASYEVVRILKDDMIDDSLRKLCVKGIKKL